MTRGSTPLLSSGEHTVAVAESLTGGLLSSRFARMADAGRWFRGGIVAYCRPVKEDLLQIGSAPVVSEEAARAMADKVAERLGAASSVAVTGVGGPDDQDGVPAGTVWIAVHTPAGTTASLHRFAGTPEEVCARTCTVAVESIEAALRRRLSAA